MFGRLFARISKPEGALPWGVGSAVSALVAAVAAIVLGSGVGLVIGGDTVYGPLLGFTIGGALLTAFIFFTRREPEARAALKIERLNENAPAPLPSNNSKAITTAGKTSRGALGPLGSSREMSPLQRSLLLLLIGIGLAIALDVVTGRITGIFLPEPELLRPYSASINGQSISFITWILAFLFMVIFQPVSEALLFQGILLPSIRQSVGAWPGFFIAAGLYAVFHLFMYYPSSVGDFTSIWYGLVAPFLAGLIFNTVRIDTGSTRSAALAHAAFGLFAVIKLLTLVG